MSNDLPIIYVVNPAVAVTGAFVATQTAAKLLATHARVVMVLPSNTSLRAANLQDFWRVDYVPMVSLSKHIPALLRYLPSLVYDAWQLKRRMRRDGATRLVLNDFYLMQGAMLRLLGFRGHIVTWVRCEPRHLVGFLAHPMLYLACKSANRMVAVSGFIRALLPPHAAVETIYDCYDGATRAPRIWQAADEKIFVYIGNYIAGKGQDMALAAFAKAAAQNSTIALHFYGGDMGLPKNRDYRAQLQIAAQQKGLAGRVTFHDFTADIYPALSSAYAALNFSVSESFSMTVLEACGAGVPVIATASGGPQEIIVAAVTGYLIPVGDVEAAAAHIAALAADPALAARMGQAGAAHVRAHFTPNIARRQLQAVLDLA